MATARTRIATPRPPESLTMALPPAADQMERFANLAGDAPVEIPASEIAAEAYSLFEARGGAHGHDVEDWLAAEALVRQRHLNQKAS